MSILNGGEWHKGIFVTVLVLLFTTLTAFGNSTVSPPTISVLCNGVEWVVHPGWIDLYVGGTRIAQIRHQISYEGMLYRPCGRNVWGSINWTSTGGVLIVSIETHFRFPTTEVVFHTQLRFSANSRFVEIDVEALTIATNASVHVRLINIEYVIDEFDTVLTENGVVKPGATELIREDFDYYASAFASNRSVEVGVVLLEQEPRGYMWNAIRHKVIRNDSRVVEVRALEIVAGEFHMEPMPSMRVSESVLAYIAVNESKPTLPEKVQTKQLTPPEVIEKQADYEVAYFVLTTVLAFSIGVVVGSRWRRRRERRQQPPPVSLRLLPVRHK